MNKYSIILSILFQLSSVLNAGSYSLVSQDIAQYSGKNRAINNLPEVQNDSFIYVAPNELKNCFWYLYKKPYKKNKNILFAEFVNATIEHSQAAHQHQIDLHQALTSSKMKPVLTQITNLILIAFKEIFPALDSLEASIEHFDATYGINDPFYMQEHGLESIANQIYARISSVLNDSTLISSKKSRSKFYSKLNRHTLDFTPIGEASEAQVMELRAITHMANLIKKKIAENFYNSYCKENKSEQ